MPNDPLYLGHQHSLCIHACIHARIHTWVIVKNVPTHRGITNSARGLIGYIATESICEGKPNGPLYLGHQVSLCIHACLHAAREASNGA